MYLPYTTVIVQHRDDRKPGGKPGRKPGRSRRLSTTFRGLLPPPHVGVRKVCTSGKGGGFKGTVLQASMG